MLFKDLQTFELILSDAQANATPSGDSQIQFQYKQILNIDMKRMYASVGIENATADDGINYTYSAVYPAAAAPLSSGLAIRFTTERPVYNPFTLAEFHAAPGTNGVRLSWSPADARPRGGSRIYRAGRNGDFTQITPALLPAGDRSYLDCTADPDSVYSYKIGSLDPVGRETVLGPFRYDRRNADSSPLGCTLICRSPNPHRGPFYLSYTVPREGAVTLAVFDVNGRMVRTLAQGSAAAGRWTARWDGRDARGRQVGAGVYFARLAAGGEQRRLRIELIR